MSELYGVAVLQAFMGRMSFDFKLREGVVTKSNDAESRLGRPDFGQCRSAPAAASCRPLTPPAEGKLPLAGDLAQSAREALRIIAFSYVLIGENR
jgi:hypothetical protein